MQISSLPSRLGAPQIIALVLLLIFAGQCVWFMAHIPLSAMEGVYVEAGLLHLERLASANSPQHSALVPLMVGLAARASGAEKHVEEFNDYRMVMRLPFLIAGVLLGASLWYVARRLYGNTGGYVALLLYCFSPLTIGSASEIGPAVVGAWGGFGLIFTSIAVAHTLYAPREVVLWNWRRILLMGLSIAICVGRAVLVLGAPAACSGIHAVGGTRAARSSAGDLQRCLSGRNNRPLGLLRLSSRRLRACSQKRELAGNWVERVRFAGTIVAATQLVPRPWVGLAHPGGGHAGDVRCLEACSFFWDSRAPARDIVTF